MWNRRAVVSLLATAGVVAGSANALAQKKDKKKTTRKRVDFSVTSSRKTGSTRLTRPVE